MNSECKVELQENLLQKFFGSKNFANFQRQLNMYGFKHLVGDVNRLAYYHEYFLRGRLSLTVMIHRNPKKGM